jgi:hypothetical protein
MMFEPFEVLLLVLNPKLFFLVLELELPQLLLFVLLQLLLNLLLFLNYAFLQSLPIVIYLREIYLGLVMLVFPLSPNFLETLIPGPLVLIDLLKVRSL